MTKKTLFPTTTINTIHYRVINSIKNQFGFFFPLLIIFFHLLITTGVYANGIDTSEIKILKNLEQRNVDPLTKLEIYAEFEPDITTVNGLTTLLVFGRLTSGFHIYSIYPQGEFAPTPTKITLNSSRLKTASKLKESPTIQITDDAYNQSLRVHKNDFQLEQKFTVSKELKKGTYWIEAKLLFQICDSVICSLPLEKNFRVKLTIK